MTTVPKLWTAATCVILAGGPSLCHEDVAFCRDRAPVLAIKDTVTLAPWAACLYACDAKWWKHYGPALTFAGPKYALEAAAAPWAAVLRNTGETGLDPDPSGLRTGRNSGYQAINLAVHLGAARILLLGYDMQPTAGRDHWFGPRPRSYWTVPPPYATFLRLFPSLVAPLAALGIAVINCSRVSALTVFPRQSLAEALA